jgi:hypothetical protein
MFRLSLKEFNPNQIGGLYMIIIGILNVINELSKKTKNVEKHNWFLSPDLKQKYMNENKIQIHKNVDILLSNHDTHDNLCITLNEHDIELILVNNTLIINHNEFNRFSTNVAIIFVDENQMVGMNLYHLGEKIYDSLFDIEDGEIPDSNLLNHRYEERQLSSILFDINNGKRLDHRCIANVIFEYADEFVLDDVGWIYTKLNEGHELSNFLNYRKDAHSLLDFDNSFEGKNNVNYQEDINYLFSKIVCKMNEIYNWVIISIIFEISLLGTFIIGSLGDFSITDWEFWVISGFSLCFLTLTVYRTILYYNAVI